jgi:hypothetical protein
MVENSIYCLSLLERCPFNASCETRCFTLIVSDGSWLALRAKLIGALMIAVN